VTSDRDFLNRTAAGSLRQTHGGAKESAAVDAQTRVAEVGTVALCVAADSHAEAERRCGLPSMRFDVKVSAWVGDGLRIRWIVFDAVLAQHLFAHHTICPRIIIHQNLARSG